MSDCLWGALDGVNEAGLSASLSFGGRTISGTGFGIPLVLRYVLETATTIEEGVAILKRIPVHMTYSVSLLDKLGNWATVFVSPDRATEVVQQKGVTNFQHIVEWAQHAQATQSVERLTTIQRLLNSSFTSGEVINGLLQKPLYQDAWLRGYGTLYSAVYRPISQNVELWWPNEYWKQQIHIFEEEKRTIRL